ncbi:MAG TPA: radical SAM family heme chaperone HemW [Actinomycetota bacterium]|nr:radical SAM family heme chaperone HemW [Actinomycetota bacterium]
MTGERGPGQGPERAGLYVHVPFCLTRCGYCDFNAYAGLGHLVPRYLRALRREAELVAPAWRDVEFVSVFFGGGTPTTVPAEALGAFLGWLRGTFRVRPGAEVTVEANPDTVDEAFLSRLLEAGVTRLSIGVQSFDPAVLVGLERVHSEASARAAYAAARRAGFGDVNLDLIYGAHGETLASWRRTLEEAVGLGPEHLSCYALTVEPATPLGRKVRLGLVPPPDPDLQAEMYGLACELLAREGYEHYEVSNWARPGHRCLHNLGYWEGRPYLGLGAGAHSFRDPVRWWNVRPPQQYLGLVEAGRVPVGGREVLSEEDRRLERLLLGLRVAEGVPAGWVPRAEAERFVEEGLARVREGRFALTDRGMLLANEVVLALAG